MKITDAIATAQGNLLRSKLRTFLTMAAVFIGTFTLALTTSISQGVQTYIDQQLDAFAQPDTVYISGGFGAPSIGTGDGPAEYDPEKKSVAASGPQISYLTNSDLEAVKKDADIIDAVPYVTAVADYIQAEGTKKYVISTDSFFERMELSLAAGSLLSESDKEGILLPYQYVETLGFGKPEDAIGKKVTVRFSEQAAFNPLVTTEPQVREVSLTVRGVLINSLFGQSAYMSNQLHEDLATFQNGTVDRFLAIVGYTAEGFTEEEQTKLKSRFEEKGYTVQTYADQVASVKQVLNIVQVVLSLFGVIALASAAIGIVNTLLMAVLERTREIGLLKALGMKRGTIFSLFTLESISIGFWGGVFGVLFASGLGSVLNVVLENGLLKNLEGFTLFAFPVVPMSLIILLGMAIGLFAGALPALRASKLDPIEALRYE